MSSWEGLKEELFFLQSTYCQPGECEVVGPPSLSYACLQDATPCCPVTLRLQLKGGQACQVTMLMTIPDDYPQVAPVLTLAIPSLSPIVLSVLEGEAAGLEEPSLFQLVDHVLQFCSDHPPQSSLRGSDNASISTKTTSHDAHIQTSRHSGQTGHECDQTPAQDPGPGPGLGRAAATECGWVVCVLTLDHMRSEQRYVHTLHRWGVELGTGGWVLVGRAHCVVVVLVGRREGVGEMVRRWRRECVDVDRRGRPCRERMMRVLCQHTPLPPGSQLASRSGVELVRCPCEDLSSWFSQHALQGLYTDLLQPALGIGH